jgi:hypothetical protein
MVATNYLLEGNDKYIRRYPEEDLVRILKDSSYHSEEWEETDSDEDSDKENGETITAVKTSIHIYEIWWRSPAVCIIIYIFFGLLFIILIRNCLIYLLKLQHLLHDRIDPTVNLLRKKEDQTRKKRVQRCKSVTNLPPKGVPSWCLNRQALEKLNRSTSNIPVYDYSDTDEEQDSSSHDTGNEVRNSNKKKHKDKKKSKKHKKRSKKN